MDSSLNGRLGGRPVDLLSPDAPAFPLLNEVQATTDLASPESRQPSPTPSRQDNHNESHKPDWGNLVGGFESLRVSRRPLSAGLRHRRSSLSSPFGPYSRQSFKKRVSPDLKSTFGTSSQTPKGGKSCTLRPSRLSRALLQLTSGSSPNGKDVLLSESHVRVRSAGSGLGRNKAGSRSKVSFPGMSKSFSSTSLPSLEDDGHHSSPTGAGMNRTFGNLSLQQPSLSQSVQDFSECCRELETFSLGEADRKTFVGFRDRSGQRGRGSRRGTGRDRGAAKPSARRREEFSPLNCYDEIEDALRDSTPKRKSRHKSKKGAGNAEEETQCHHESSAHCTRSPTSCAAQARKTESYADVSVDDLAGYLENSIVFPKKMSYMAEMMYT